MPSRRPVHRPVHPSCARATPLRAGWTLAVAVLAAGAAPLAAQGTPAPTTTTPVPNNGPEVVRGRVIDDSARAVFAAAITVTRGPDRLTQTTTTDSAGRYSVRFEQGTGDYLVYVSAPGFRPARRRIERQASERELVADFSLGRDLAMLAAVQVRGERPARATNPIRPQTPETGAAEKWVDGVGGQLPPTVAGDLNALAGTIPGVTLTATGPAILGSGTESNLTTLNGLALAGGSIPRAARTETRVTGATFDPTRGGFSGANIDVRLGPGDRFFQRRIGFLTLDAPQLQFTDAVGRASGAANGGFRGSLGADGELIRQTMTYNVALDVARNTSDPATLIDAEAETLLRAGVAPDSVARLRQLSGPLGLPLSGGGIPTARNRDAVTWLGRLDDTRDTLRTRTFTSYAGYTKEGALGFGPLTAPSVGGRRTERNLGAQLVVGDFVGPGRRILTETRLSASTTRTEATPYRNLPGATVLVRSSDRSALDDRFDVAGITLGGGPFVASDEGRWIVEGANETIWNARGRRHRFKAQLWARGDGLRQAAFGNALGNYTFNSIADFAADRPASYTRTLEQPERRGTVWNGAAALAHQWIPSRWFSLLYGARVEGNAFGDRPAENPALERALGVATGLAPARLHVSPRLGFSYTYNRDRENGSGTSQSSVGRFYRTTAGVIRGGIGEFRDLLRPGVLADASASTGLAGGTSLLSCVGAAVPSADWSLFASDPSAIPSQCASGGGVLAERAPSVTLIDRDYDVPRSWRASLDWNTSWNRLLLRVGALGSYDLAQPGVVDANFGGTTRFALASEGNRPVFVTPAAIDAASGAVSATEARRAPEFGRVGMRTSDLRGYGGQLTFAVSPDVFKFRGRGSFFSSVAYTLQGTKRQYRGFDGAAFGDPSLREWAAGPNDARHQVVLQGGFSTQKSGTVTFFGRTQSGLPYTPLVQGDVNGDGRGGDRAFVPASGAESDAQLAQQIASLLATGAPGARDCLMAYAGGGAQRVPRAVDADTQRAVASADPAPLGEPPHDQRVPAERARRHRPAAARRRVAARLGRHGGARSGAAGAARLRRRGPPLPLRREPALRRHARAPHAAARAVPPEHRLLAQPGGRLPGAAAAPRARAGAHPDRRVGTADGRLAGRVLSLAYLEHPPRAAGRERLALPVQGAGRGAAAQRLGLLRRGAADVRRARTVPRQPSRRRARQGGAGQCVQDREGVLEGVLAAAGGRRFRDHADAARALPDAAQHGRRAAARSRELAVAVRLSGPTRPEGEQAAGAAARRLTERSGGGAATPPPLTRGACRTRAAPGTGTAACVRRRSPHAPCSPDAWRAPAARPDPPARSTRCCRPAVRRSVPCLAVDRSGSSSTSRP
jgi:hypothetical protein